MQKKEKSRVSSSLASEDAKRRGTYMYRHPSLGEGDSSLFKWRAKRTPFCKGDNYEIAKLLWQHFLKSSLEPLDQFQPTCHEASLGEGNDSLFKWMETSFSNGR